MKRCDRCQKDIDISTQGWRIVRTVRFFVKKVICDYGELIDEPYYVCKDCQDAINEFSL